MNCKSVFPLVGVSVLLPLFAAVDATAQFVAFNDHAPGAGTGPNTTTWNALGEAPSSGPLKNITTGATLPVTLNITRTATGVSGAATQGSPAAGTPLYNTFNGFVDFQGTPNPSVQVEAAGVVTYTFTGLNPSKRYSFKGSAVRGNVTYTDRWTLMGIVGADSFTSAHTANALTTAKVPSLTGSQVAINTGVNNTAATGDMAAWENINPGTDGSFAVTCRQYTGTVPGGSSAGARAYGITGLRLEEFNVTPVPVTITNQPQDQVVDELQRATFSVGATGNPAPTYQWYKNDALIGGATNASYTIAAAPLSDNNARFKVIAANTVNSINYSQTSGVGVLRVSADTTPPRLIEAQPLGLTQVKVAFSERVRVATATSIANYTFTSGNGSLTLSAATLDASQTNVLLDISPLTEGVLYTVTVNGVRDQSAAANQIAANSQTTFIAVSYTPQDIGSPPLAGSAVAAPGGYDVTGSGADIGGTADQFHLSYQQLTSDFDLKVRVAGLDVSDVWAKAGLMARETLDADSRFAAVLATPTLSGCFFQSRTTVGASASSAGSFPVNYPSTWLRLRRAGDVFTGFASVDGDNWTQLGAATIAMPGTIYVGLAVSSHNPGATTTAQLRDLSVVVGGNIGNVTLNREPPGPSSRKTGLAITEIMYRPAPRADGRDVEFVELFNANPFYEDISGYRLAGDIDFTFPPNTIIQGGASLVVAKIPDDVKAVYKLSDVMGPYAGSLKTSGTVRLRNQIGAIYLDIPYLNKPPWPVAADGTGHSLVLARPSYGEGYAQAWDISDVVGGSPGAFDGYRPGPLRNVVINEFLAHTDPPLVDYVELYNHGNQAVDISGCALTDDPNTNKFVVPLGSTIPPRGFTVFYETNLHFALSAAGETIYLKSADGSRVLDAIQFEGQANGVSSGRFPDGAPDIYPLATRTPGAANSRILVRDVVINEIMYEPISGDDNDQYVELYNKGSTTINLGGWRFTDGINFTFPSNTVIQSGAYLVVAKNATNLFAKYGNLNSANTVGNFGGRLSGKSERLALSMPDVQVNTNTPGVITTNTAYVVVDEVTYASGGRWGNWANGGGSSLELIDARANHRLAPNWADSDETAKAPWTTIEATGVLDLGSSYSSGQTTTPINRLEVLGLGEGEFLLDDVEVIGTGGANLVGNPNFEGGLGGWVPQGNHVRSSLETSEGFNSAQSLHVRASSRGDTAPNRVRTALTSALTANQTATVRGHARWLRGWPELVLRIKGNYFEATGRMTVPANLGTPGARNSRAVANAGPAIYSVAHTPVLPAASEPVVVTARVHDPDGFSAPRLLYRIDPATGYSTVTMTDDGTGGDVVAGDGTFSAMIPGQSAGTLAAFYVQVADNGSPGATSSFPNDAPTHECLVRFGDPAPTLSFGIYRQWFTQSAVNSWINRPVLSNERVEGTFVYGNFRAIYNFSSRYAGSPYHQGFTTPLGNCHYSIEIPLDDLLLGTENFNKVHAPGNGPFDDNTSQREQTAYWLARQLDVPWNYRRYVVMYVNGNRRGQVMEDSQTPGTDVVEQYFPDDADGDLYKLQPWFEFDDGSTGSTGFNNKSWNTLNNYLSGGVKKLARYRWNFLKRAVEQTANNYTNVYRLVDTANALLPGDYTANMDAIVDTEEWMRIFAVEHATGNWDSFGYQNSQNMYGYKPQRGKWTLMMWDYNIVLGNSGSHGPDGSQLFNISLNNQDQGAMSRFYGNPKFRRAYLRAFKELADGPMQSFNVGPVMDAKYDAFVASGITVTAPTAVKSWIATMRQSLLNAVNTQNGAAPFAITSNGGADFSTDQNLVTLTGTAPVDVKTIKINGIAYSPRWTTVAAWSLQIPVQPGVNALTVEGYDSKGNLVGGASATINVTYTGAGAAPEQSLVINEIMYNAAVPDASFVEIYNRSASFTFDLSRYRLDGADFTFPDGTIIAPGGFAVIANDSYAFAAAYGGSIPVVGEFGGRLQNGGETLKLVRPGATLGTEIIVNRVRYDSALPWPTNAGGFGPSVQLRDPLQDNSRVANWAASSINGGAALYTPGAANSTLTTLPPMPALWINEILPNNVSGLADRFGHREPWIEIYNASANAVSLDGLYLTDNYTNLTVWPFPAGTVINPKQFLIVWADGKPSETGSGELHTSFRLNETGGSVALVWTATGAPLVLDYLNYSTFSADRSYGSYPDGQPFTRQVFHFTSPGGTNIPTSVTVPVVINEFMAGNTHTLTNCARQYDDWIELYNTGNTTVDLSGYYLTDNLTNKTKWAFPQGTFIPAHGYRLVWADDAPCHDTDLHALFKLGAGGEQIGLFAPDGTLIDGLTFPNQKDDVSYGRWPDGAGSTFYSMNQPTPRAANILAANNSPPSVGSITDKTVDELSLLTFTATADDPDAPTQQLTFSLDSNAPDGAAINAQSGLFTWQPVEDQGPGIYTIVVRATDNGSPPLSGSRSFRVTVSEMNSAPVLSPIPDQTISVGNVLSVTAGATDADRPAQKLTFSLDPGAPTGATLDASSGLFSWTPLPAQAPSTNTISVRVTDDGSPPLAAFRTFAVIVREAPTFSATALLVNNVITITWQTIPGKTYQVQHNTSLTDGSWQALGANLTAPGSTASMTDTPTNTQRFYRVVRLD